MSEWQWVGAGLMGLVVAVMIGATVAVTGWRVALGAWAFSFAMCGVITVAAFLLDGWTP